jgi:hypothetical protein
MTDRELLEAAAKAAGIEFAGYGADGKTGWRKDGIHNARWNPLTDDGDALRVVVALELELYYGDDEGGTTACVGYTMAAHAETAGMVAYMIEYVRDDPLAATRRAIVRAAAAMTST